MKFKHLLEKSILMKEEDEYGSQLIPIGQPVGGIKDPDWLPVAKEYDRYVCAACGYPLIGYGKTLSNSAFILARKTNIVFCPNCRGANDLDEFDGYIGKDGKINKKYFNRTNPIYDNEEIYAAGYSKRPKPVKLRPL